jgi:hypothetical protein
MIRRDAGLWYVGEQWIERAYYDATAKATMAPLSEAREVVAILNHATPASSDLVAVVETMMERLGISYKSAASRIRSDGSAYLWDGKIIPGATYDRRTQKTMAPLAAIASLS